MATVYIPRRLQSLTNGQDVIEARGRNVKEVIADIEARFPGFARQVCDGDRVRPGLSVAVGTKVTGIGLLEEVAPDSEVHFLPAVSGG